MKKLIFILFLFVPIFVFAQNPIQTKRLKADSLFIKELNQHLDNKAEYTGIYAYDDSLWMVTSDSTVYNLLDWLDSLGVHSVRYYGVVDSLAQHRIEIDALESGSNVLLNDTWFTSYDGAGNPVNVFKITPQNQIMKGVPEFDVSQNAYPDAMVVKNNPLRDALYGDTVGRRYSVGNYKLFESYGIADGTGALAKRQHDFKGVLKADTLYSAGVAVATKQYFRRELAADAENNITVTFPLESTTKVFYNGQALSNTRWSGVGSTTINLSLSTRKYDELIIYN